MVSPYYHLTGSRKSESPTKHIAPPPPPRYFFVLCHLMLSGHFCGYEIRNGNFRELTFGAGIFWGFV